ncbi:unnamed protein product [Brassicogethes aeneus]|uniref:Uncharacterized protein n=1 Tax=Brassicogethes aeneus TaxID=1431903 RepID=A0A9P0BIS8_BRAAE|nr:unnamed protein product [Brassicogethes aeneus]
MQHIHLDLDPFGSDDCEDELSSSEDEELINIENEREDNSETKYDDDVGGIDDQNEIKAAVNQSTLKRDESLGATQIQIGSSLAALGKALSVLLNMDEETNLPLIEAISDAARLLADVHFQESESHRALVSLTLKKDLKDTLINAAYDGWGKPRIYTDTPEKERLLELANIKEQKKCIKEQRQRAKELNTARKLLGLCPDKSKKQAKKIKNRKLSETASDSTSCSGYFEIKDSSSDSNFCPSNENTISAEEIEVVKIFYQDISYKFL